jgi:hypothetical protein
MVLPSDCFVIRSSENGGQAQYHISLSSPSNRLPFQIHSQCIELNDQHRQLVIGQPLRAGAEKRIEMTPEMNDQQLLCYSRQIMLPQIDMQGQQALWSSRVLIIGVVGFGSPVALYLALRCSQVDKLLH